MTILSQRCKICAAESGPFGSAMVLHKHLVHYYRCVECGFIQTEEPFWLDEAYSAAITRSDIGLVQRNLSLASTTSLIIRLFFDPNRRFIDYGGGYGLFVRLMRDRGMDFFWHDPHSENLFAQNFEADLAKRHSYELLTAFEVMEHLVNPLDDVTRMQHAAPSLLFSTNLVPEPAPPLDRWWYYGLEHGQHVGFHTVESLRRLGERFGLRLYTRGNLHLLTPKRLNPLLFRMAMLRRAVQVWDLIRPERSLIQADYARIAGQAFSRG